jgi:PiT family inorganic phosphate transporter
MDLISAMTLGCIVLLVVFDYTNGFHDTANMVAASVATQAMTPAQAIALVSVFTFLGPVLGGTAVAETVGQFVLLDGYRPAAGIAIVLAGVAGAISWNLLTWWRGLPSSSSHALVGGLVGAVLISAGPDHVNWGWSALVEQGQWSGVTKIVAALLLSPIAGFLAGLLLIKLMFTVLLRRATPRINHSLCRLQWLGAAWLAFSHGANDGQKSMGVITLVLVLGGFITEFDVPFWVMATCASAITLGTMSGGWRIVRTVGFGIYKLRPAHALGSQVAAAAVIGGAAALGGPVSTTHVVSSAIMGIGAGERPKAVRWGKAGELLFTWFVTVPVTAVFGAAVGYAIGVFS